MALDKNEKNNNEDVKLLYACLAFNKSNEIDMDKVAGFMGLSRGASDKRFSRLRSKLVETYAQDASAGSPPAIISSRGSKRGLKAEEEPTPTKKAKTAIASRGDDGDGDGNETEEEKIYADGN